MISFRNKGNFIKTRRYFKRANQAVGKIDFKKYGQEGVKALASQTPVDTGSTAESWYYEIIKKKGSTIISFNNNNIQNGALIAIILQYGHGTRNGGWVEGRDYINPSIQPVFDRIADDAWKEVTKV